MAGALSAMIAAAFRGSAGFTVVQTFTATSTWTCPTGVTSVDYLVVGAAVGAVVGDRMQNDDTNETRNVERCTQRDNYQRVQEGYMTLFSYNGHEFEEETQTKYRVGQKVSVQVNAIIEQTN